MASEHVDGLAAMRTVVDGNSLFLAKLYPILVEDNGQSNDLVMSIFSLSSVLAMAYVGANGNTHEEMKHVLSFPTDQEVNMGYQEVLSTLKSNPNFTLDVANQIFIQDKFPFLDSYIEQLRTYFLVDPQTVNFVKSEEARQDINTWVEQKTHDKIKVLIPGGALSYRTKAVLVNAVYFKGNWAAQFDKKLTRSSKFHVSPTEAMDVDMMHISGKFKATYPTELGCTILDMPYKGGRLSMLFFLSDDPEGFDKMEKNLYTGNMSSIRSTQFGYNYEVAIPRFKIETTHQLVQPLKELGLVDMFNETKADFSGMTGTKNLFVSHVVQKAFIEVNEEGSKAIAASGIVLTYFTSAPMPLRQFICDRPFLFAIKDNLSGMILFNGRVMKPTVQQQSNDPKGTSSDARRLEELTNLTLLVVLCALNLTTLNRF